MAFLYDQTVEELTASTWKKVTIGVLLTLIFHLGDVLLGGRLAKNYKINVSEIGKVNHLPFCFYKMHSPVANAQAKARLCHFVEAKWQMVYLSDFQSVNFVVFGEVSPQQSIAQMENKGQEDSYSHFFPRRCCYFFDSVVVQKSH